MVEIENGPEGEPVDPATALAALGGLTSGAGARLMLFAVGPDAELQGFRLTPTGSVLEEFRSAALAWAAQMQERTLVPYTAGRRPDPHELVWRAASRVAPLTPILNQLETAVDREVFVEASDEAKRLRLYVLTLESPNPGPVHFLKAMSSHARLKRSKRIALFWRDGVFDVLQEDPFLFDVGFDAAVLDDVVLVDDQRDFERSIGFLELAAEAARATVEGMALGLRIRNHAALLDAVAGDVNMIAKVRSIREKMDADIQYREAMTMDRIVAFVHEHPGLGIVLEGDAGEEELVFYPDPQRRWQILKFLDDDYLRSPLTDKDYEANSKTVVT